jgi:hypothetical protein
MEKTCRRCGKSKDESMFRLRPSGFRLNQCRECESELGKVRRLAKVGVSPMITITTKSGVKVEASTTAIAGGRMTASPNTDKVLYFGSDVNRDTARLAFSVYANVDRTGITYKTI